MTKNPLRVELTEEAFRMIEAEAFLSGKTAKHVASEMVLKYSSKEAIEADRTRQVFSPVQN